MIITDEKRTQILSYIVHAGEILQENNHFPQKKYNYAYLPIGSELYTGTIKAGGYLFLDKNIKEVIFIVEQNEIPEEIIYYGKEEEFLIYGRTIKNKKNNNNIENISRELFDQLIYLRILTKIETVSIIGIGSKMKKSDIQKEISNLGYSDFCIIILGKTGEEKGNKTEDINMIEHILAKKTYKKKNDWLGNLFIFIAKTYKKKPELVAYTHSSEIGIKTLPQIGYICMVA